MSPRNFDIRPRLEIRHTLNELLHVVVLFSWRGPGSRAGTYVCGRVNGDAVCLGNAFACEQRSREGSGERVACTYGINDIDFGCGQCRNTFKRIYRTEDAASGQYEHLEAEVLDQPVT